MSDLDKIYSDFNSKNKSVSIADLIVLGGSVGIEAAAKKSGKKIHRDAFGHVRLDELNAGKWFAKQLGKRLNAKKILVQKSGYFGRSSKANQADLDLILILSRLKYPFGNFALLISSASCSLFHLRLNVFSDCFRLPSFRVCTFPTSPI